MSIRVTDEAMAVIRRSLELSGSDPGEIGVRLRVAGGQVRPRFVTGPEPGDETVEAEGIRIFLAPDLVGSGDVEIGVTEEHDTLVVRPVS